jgi:hypothetical protein
MQAFARISCARGHEWVAQGQMEWETQTVVIEADNELAWCPTCGDPYKLPSRPLTPAWFRWLFGLRGKARKPK